MSSHHTKTCSGIFGFGSISGKLSTFVLLCSLTFLPVSPAFANSDTASSTESLPQEETKSPVQSEPTESTAPADETEKDQEHDLQDVPTTDPDPGIQTDAEEVTTENDPSTTTQSATTEEAGESVQDEDRSATTSVSTSTPPAAEDIATTTGGATDAAATTTASSTQTQTEAHASSTSDVDRATSTDSAAASTTLGSSSSTSTTTDDGTMGGSDTDETVTDQTDVTNNISTTTNTDEDLDRATKQVAGVTTSDQEASTTSSDTQRSDDQLETIPESTHVRAATVINDQNRYQFNKEQCLSVGDGTYYCTNDDDSGAVDDEDSVFVRSDEGGDREIFMRTGDEVTQITDNMVDDDAAYYDAHSNTIVWHRLVDGRYQIFEYDLATKEEHQLTSERYNNMQPVRDGSMTVWQGWVGDDWEIMLEQDDAFTMLTDNNVHDIAPHINGEYVIWQSREDTAWHVKVYDTTTGETETISDDTGASVENPRFVLVYDTKLENGDVETRGYDIKSGKNVPLSARPASVPRDIPDPDPTEEERAMIETLTKTKTRSDEELDEGDDVVPDINDNTKKATSSSDIVVPPYTDDVAATSTESFDASSDVVIPPDETRVESHASSSAGQVSTTDVVIPQYTGTTTSHDSQDGVATST